MYVKFLTGFFRNANFRQRNIYGLTLYHSTSFLCLPHKKSRPRHHPQRFDAEGRLRGRLFWGNLSPQSNIRQAFALMPY